MVSVVHVVGCRGDAAAAAAAAAAAVIVIVVCFHFLVIHPVALM